MISIEKRDRIDIISFAVNKIDAMNADEVREVFRSAFSEPHARVVVDMKGVDYIDSSGFGCFLTAHRAARNNYGILRIVNPEPRIMELFRTLQLHTIFDISDDLEACVRSLR